MFLCEWAIFIITLKVEMEKMNLRKYPGCLLLYLFSLRLSGLKQKRPVLLLFLITWGLWWYSWVLLGSSIVSLEAALKMSAWGVVI